MAKGMYTPKNPEKYRGDPRKIRFLSSWEARFMAFCDTNPNVLEWASEEVRIQYWHPIKKKVATYVPDFLIKYKNTRGEVITRMIEIKPNKENPDRVVKEGVIGKRRKKTSVYDAAMMIINNSKWTAARAFCAKAGIEFSVLTEQEMFKQ